MMQSSDEPGDRPPETVVSDMEKLRFYRDEVKHEYNLLATRSTILVTCQSFLVVPFAILNTAANFRSVLAAEYLVATLGIYTSLVLIGPIEAGHRALREWLVKQRLFMRSVKGMKDLVVERDLLTGPDADMILDRDHIRSLAFTHKVPWAFVAFWVGAIIFSTVRAILGL